MRNTERAIRKAIQRFCDLFVTKMVLNLTAYSRPLTQKGSYVLYRSFFFMCFKHLSVLLGGIAIPCGLACLYMVLIFLVPNEQPSTDQA